MKSENIVLSAENIEKLRIYSEIEGKDIAEFANGLLSEAIENYLHIRHGDVIARIPNPQVNIIDDEKANEFIGILEDAGERIYRLDANMQFPVFSFAEYFEQRLFGDSEEERAKFSENLIFDCTQGGNSATS